MNDSAMDDMLDLRGVKCPMNFVKLKLALSKMDTGAILKAVIDDGESIDRVPKSLESEGYSILEEKMLDNSWELVIKNK